MADNIPPLVVTNKPTEAPKLPPVDSSSSDGSKEIGKGMINANGTTTIPNPAYTTYKTAYDAALAHSTAYTAQQTKSLAIAQTKVAIALKVGEQTDYNTAIDKKITSADTLNSGNSTSLTTATRNASPYVAFYDGAKRSYDSASLSYSGAVAILTTANTNKTTAHTNETTALTNQETANSTYSSATTQLATDSENQGTAQTTYDTAVALEEKAKNDTLQAIKKVQKTTEDLANVDEAYAEQKAKEEKELNAFIANSGKYDFGISYEWQDDNYNYDGQGESGGTPKVGYVGSHRGNGGNGGNGGNSGSNLSVTLPIIPSPTTTTPPPTTPLPPAGGIDFNGKDDGISVDIAKLILPIFPDLQSKDWDLSLILKFLSPPLIPFRAGDYRFTPSLGIVQDAISGDINDWMAGGKLYNSEKAGNAYFHELGDLNTVRFLGLEDKNFNPHLSRKMQGMANLYRMLQVTAGASQRNENIFQKLNQANVANSITREEFERALQEAKDKAEAQQEALQELEDNANDYTDATYLELEEAVRIASEALADYNLAVANKDYADAQVILTKVTEAMDTAFDLAISYATTYVATVGVIYSSASQALLTATTDLKPYQDAVDLAEKTYLASNTALEALKTEKTTTNTIYDGWLLGLQSKLDALEPKDTNGNVIVQETVAPLTQAETDVLTQTPVTATIVISNPAQSECDFNFESFRNENGGTSYKIEMSDKCWANVGSTLSIAYKHTTSELSRFGGNIKNTWDNAGGYIGEKLNPTKWF